MKALKLLVVVSLEMRLITNITNAALHLDCKIQYYCKQISGSAKLQNPLLTRVGLLLST